MQRELKQTRETLAETPASREDLVAETKQKIAMLEGYLPKQMSEAEIQTAIEKIIAETAVTEITERGATRMDDQASEAAMEQRKKQGYF